MLRFGHYNPRQNFIELSMLADGPTIYKDEFAQMLPQLRRRWGYEDFETLTYSSGTWYIKGAREGW